MCYKNENYIEAIELCTELLSKDPNDIDALVIYS